MASHTTVLSETERKYILGGVRENVRADGRGCRDVRHFSLRLGVVSNTNGSALVERVRSILILRALLICCTFLQERTSAIIGVKAELGDPRPSTPDEGRLEFHVDW